MVYLNSSHKSKYWFQKTEYRKEVEIMRKRKIKMLKRVVISVAIATAIALKVASFGASVFLSIGVGVASGVIFFAGAEIFAEMGAVLITIKFIAQRAKHNHRHAHKSRDKPRHKSSSKPAHC